MCGVLDVGEISQIVGSHCFECHLTMVFGVTFENKLVLAFPGEEMHFFSALLYGVKVEIWKLPAVNAQRIP